jgi:opacity protein-like surface antigen
MSVTYKVYAGIFITAGIIQYAHAGTMGEVDTLPAGIVVTLSGGPSWNTPGEDRTLTLAPEVLRAFVSSDNTNTVGTGRLFLGLQRPLASNIFGQIGLEVSGSSGTKVSGIILENAEPAFDNYTYEYKITHADISLKGKALYDEQSWLAQPYVSASVGLAFNHSYSYSNTPVIATEVAPPPYASNTNPAFTYTVGAGLQKPINNTWSVGVGYEFSDWGRADLGPVAGQQTNSVLSTDHVYNNALMFQVSYLG